jgi:hypothetical protein
MYIRTVAMEGRKPLGVQTPMSKGKVSNIFVYICVGYGDMWTRASGHT